MKKNTDFKQGDAVTINIYRSETIKFMAGHIVVRTYPRLRNGILTDGVIIDFRPKDHKEGERVSGVIKKKAGTGLPDVRVHLYGLDIDAIEDVWSEIKERLDWGLLSKYKMDTQSKSIRHNSASLCLFLLFFGGITQSHSVVPTDTLKWFFEWCESGLKLALKSTLSLGVSTVKGLEIITASTSQQKIEAALKLIPEIKESVSLTLTQAGTFGQKTAEIFSVTPGEVEDLVLQCKKNQDDVLKITLNKDNTLQDILPPVQSGYCLIA